MAPPKSNINYPLKKPEFKTLSLTSHESKHTFIPDKLRGQWRNLQFIVIDKTVVILLIITAVTGSLYMTVFNIYSIRFSMKIVKEIEYPS